MAHVAAFDLTDDLGAFLDFSFEEVLLLQDRTPTVYIASQVVSFIFEPELVTLLLDEVSHHQIRETNVREATSNLLAVFKINEEVTLQDDVSAAKTVLHIKFGPAITLVRAIGPFD